MGHEGERKNIVLGVTGSIASYKSAELARLLVQWGFNVRVVMSDAAQKFITPLTLGTLTSNPVITSFWDEAESHGIGHIQAADWAHAVIVAPASADFIAKLAYGAADSPLLALCLATKSPILLAPAMNVNMLSNPQTQSNLLSLQARGISVVPCEEGELACGWVGAGRMSDPWEVLYHVRRTTSVGDLKGKRVLVTTGPTREPIDEVRFISNRSSGKMGVELAREAFVRGAEVMIINGPAVIRVPQEIACYQVTTADEMRQAVIEYGFGEKNDGGKFAPDIVIMAAAVCDVKPKVRKQGKLKKKDLGEDVKLVLNDDILAGLGVRRGSDSAKPILIGFSVETGELEDLISEANRKMREKQIDIIVGNFAQDAFELDTTKVWIIDKHGRQDEVATTYKSRVANRILDAIRRV